MALHSREGVHDGVESIAFARLSHDVDSKKASQARGRLALDRILSYIASKRAAFLKKNEVAAEWQRSSSGLD